MIISTTTNWCITNACVYSNQTPSPTFLNIPEWMVYAIVWYKLCTQSWYSLFRELRVIRVFIRWVCCCTIFIFRGNSLTHNKYRNKMYEDDNPTVVIFDFYICCFTTTPANPIDSTLSIARATAQTHRFAMIGKCEWKEGKSHTFSHIETSKVIKWFAWVGVLRLIYVCLSRHMTHLHSKIDDNHDNNSNNNT